MKHTIHRFTCTTSMATCVTTEPLQLTCKLASMSCSLDDNYMMKIHLMPCGTNARTHENEFEFRYALYPPSFRMDWEIKDTEPCDLDLTTCTSDDVQAAMLQICQRAYRKYLNAHKYIGRTLADFCQVLPKHTPCYIYFRNDYVVWQGGAIAGIPEAYLAKTIRDYKFDNDKLHIKLDINC